jgi:hypothetical protein
VTTVDPDGATEQPASPLPLSPLTISALMVTKSDLISALRIYLPNIADADRLGCSRREPERLMTTFPSVEIVPGGTGLLHFQADATNASGGYGIFKTANGHLTFQGGPNGYMYVNQAANAVLATMTNGGDVGIGTAGPLARLEIRGAAGEYETLALSADSQSTITMRTKASTSLRTVVFSSNYGDGSAGAIAGSTTRVESGGGFAVGIGVGVGDFPFHQGSGSC